MMFLSKGADVFGAGGLVSPPQKAKKTQQPRPFIIPLAQVFD